MKAPSRRLIVVLALAIVALLCLASILVAFAPLFATVTLVVTLVAMYVLATGLYARDGEGQAVLDHPAEAEHGAPPANTIRREAKWHS